MKARNIIAILAAAAVIMTAAGCSGNTSGSGESTVSESSSENSPADNSGSTAGTAASVLTADTAADTVIASCEGRDDMNITFGQFLKEYKYYMQNYGLTDDTSSDNADTLQIQRERIVNYLINEKIFMVKYKELLPELTEEELAQIRSDGDKTISDMKQSCKDGISSMSVEKFTDEELDKKADDAFDALLSECGLTEEDFHNWAYSAAIQNKLLDYVNRDFTLDESEAETQLQNVIDGARSSYESDPANYDGNSYASVYIPEGSRYIEQIALKLPDADITEINDLRDNGDDEGADALRAEKLKSLDEKLAEVQAKIDAGEDFEALMKEYSDDSDTSAKYLITPGAEIYVNGLSEAAMGIAEVGGMTTFGSDYGYHIIKNLGTAEVDPEQTKQMTQAIYNYLLENYKAQNFNAAVREWRDEYKFTIDRDILMLAEETAETDTTGSSAASEDTAE